MRKKHEDDDHDNDDDDDDDDQSVDVELYNRDGDVLKAIFVSCGFVWHFHDTFLSSSYATTQTVHISLSLSAAFLTL
jgi:hypothetical protein